MLRAIKKLAISLTAIMAIVGVGVVLTAPEAVAQPLSTLANAKSEIRDGMSATNTGGPGLQATIRNVVNILLFVVGLVSVIMIIVGGLRYVLSAGDSNAISSAKNTVLYAVIGVVVAFMAYAIVNFVIDKL